jgi:ABC-type Fe3+/spermidine/putrescine transport system ATPase subunit
MSKLEVKNLTKSYAQSKILNDISFTVNDGEFLSFLGPSGCGKTTILKIITGLEQPDGGEIKIDGKSILGLPTEKRNIGMVFQNYALFPNMTVYGNVAYGLKVRHIGRQKIANKVKWMLELVQMSGMEDRKVTKLSGGQQQRVALARALVIEPNVLLLDEPLSALDRKIRVEMQTEIRNIQQKLGITTIFVTHDQEEAMTMSDQIILMNNGTVEQNADPVTLYNNPVSVFASDFLGRANILKGTVHRQPQGFVLEGYKWSFNIANTGGIKDGMEVTAAIRGENFIITKEASPGACKAKILARIFAGTLCKFVMQIGNDSVEVLTLGRYTGSFADGEAVYLSVDPQNIHIYCNKEETGK